LLNLLLVSHSKRGRLLRRVEQLEVARRVTARGRAAQRELATAPMQDIGRLGRSAHVGPRVVTEIPGVEEELVDVCLIGHAELVADYRAGLRDSYGRALEAPAALDVRR